MTVWEYKVVPAPRRGTKTKAAKTTEDRFAVALEELMNSWGAQGWEYVRAETLPVEERKGLTGKAVTTQHMLVFRRTKASHTLSPTAQAPAAPTLGPAVTPAGAAPTLEKPE